MPGIFHGAHERKGAKRTKSLPLRHVIQWKSGKQGQTLSVVGCAISAYHIMCHIAFASVESMEQRADIVFNNLYSWLEGTQLNAI